MIDNGKSEDSLLLLLLNAWQLLVLVSFKGKKSVILNLAFCLVYALKGISMAKTYLICGAQEIPNQDICMSTQEDGFQCHQKWRKTEHYVRRLHILWYFVLAELLFLEYMKGEHWLQKTQNINYVWCMLILFCQAVVPKEHSAMCLSEILLSSYARQFTKQIW